MSAVRLWPAYTPNGGATHATASPPTTRPGVPDLFDLTIGRVALCGRPVYNRGRDDDWRRERGWICRTCVRRS